VTVWIGLTPLEDAMLRSAFAVVVSVSVISVISPSARADAQGAGPSSAPADQGAAQAGPAQVEGAAPNVQPRGGDVDPELPPNAPPRPKKLNLSGPRVGLTLLSQGVRDKIAENTSQDDLKPVVSQFGWQWERQIAGSEGGLVGLTEWVLLVGGLEQSTFLPSLTWLVGVRSPKGVEFGVGPNITTAGTAIALAAGVNVRRGTLSFPINLAVVPSKSGVRVSLLVGFTTR
jgi:hypothetical protein